MNKRIKKKHAKWLLHKNYATIIQTIVFMDSSEIECYEESVVNDLFRFCILHTTDDSRRKIDETWSEFLWSMNRFLMNIHDHVCDLWHNDVEREVVGAAIPNGILVKALRKRARCYVYPADIMKWYNWYRSRGRFDYFISAVKKTGNIYREVDEEYDEEYE